MDRSEVEFTNKNKPLKGLQDEGLVNFCCRGCEKKLLVLQMTSVEGNKAKAVLTRVTVECGLCGDYSSVQQVTGQFYPGAPSDNMVFDVVEDHTGAPETDILFKAWNK